MNDHFEQCAWESGGRHCRFPGSVSHSVTGGGPWYCAKHARCSDGRTGAAIVNESMSWTRVTRQDAEEIHTARVATWLHARGLSRREGEARSEYIGRLRGFVRSSLPTVGNATQVRSVGWAQRVIERYIAGEVVADLPFRMACEVRHRDPDDVRAAREAASGVTYVHEPA